MNHASRSLVPLSLHEGTTGSIVVSVVIRDGIDFAVSTSAELNYTKPYSITQLASRRWRTDFQSNRSLEQNPHERYAGFYCTDSS